MLRSFSRSSSAAMLLALACAWPAWADTVVFSEGFGTVDWGIPASTSCNPDFPAGWTRHNQDGLPPNSQVSWVNDAWVASNTQDWTAETGNCAAFSTSYYNPTAAADDWLVTPAIAVPAIHPKLRFRARAQDADNPDGYEVRWATSSGVAALSANPALLTVAAEGATWTAREIDLSGLAGQTVHFAFRNQSSDKFLLLLDDVQVASVLVHDAAITAALRPHAELLRVPVGQAPALQLGATVRNGGASALTNAVVTAQVLLDGNPVHSVQAAAISSLAPGATADVTMPAYTVATPGTVTVQYTVATAEADDDASNNAMTSASLEVTDWELGRDDGTATLHTGIGGDGGQLGTRYTLAQPGWVHAIRYHTSGANTDLAGAAVVGELRAMSAGKPGALLAQTQPYTVPTPPVAGFADLPLAAPLLLPAGDYYFGVVEPGLSAGLDGSLGLGLSATLYQAGRNWVRSASGAPDWSLMESLGVLLARAPMLRVVFGPADTMPPTTTAGPTITHVAGSTTASASVTVNEPATGYWQVLPAATATPSAVHLKDHGTSVHLTTAAAAVIPIASLALGSSYNFHFIAYDVANNVQASVTSVPFVAVGPPGAPASVTTMAGEGSAIITWTAPASDGGSPITHYSVTGSPAGTCAPGLALTCTITGLAYGVPHTFTVTATNAAGTGAGTSAAAAIPYGPPAPTETFVSGPGTHTITDPSLPVVVGPGAGGAVLVLPGSGTTPVPVSVLIGGQALDVRALPGTRLQVAHAEGQSVLVLVVLQGWAELTASSPGQPLVLAGSVLLRSATAGTKVEGVPLATGVLAGRLLPPAGSVPQLDDRGLLAGERLQVDAQGAITLLALGSVASSGTRVGDAAPLPSLGAHITLAAPLARLQGPVARLGSQTWLDVLRTHSQGAAWTAEGGVHVPLGEWTLPLWPQLPVRIDTRLPDGATFTPEGLVQVVRKGLVLTLAPTLADWPAFAQALDAPVRVSTEGVLSVALAGQAWALRPALLAGPDGPPGFGVEADGTIRFGGQRLPPAFANYAAARALLLDALTDAQAGALPQPEGTLGVALPDGSHWLLQPDAQLADPAMEPDKPWWLGSDGALYLRLGTVVQRVHVLPAPR